MKTEEEAKRKKEILLGINPCIYGLNYHDPAVVVLIDGRVAFGVEEERCNRVKHSKGVFPSEALANCLAYCNLTWNDIDAVVIGYEPTLWMNRLNLELLDIINPYINYESNSLQIRGSELIEKIIKTNIVERYTFFRSKENVRKLIVEKCSAPKTTRVLFCEHHLAHIASSYEVSGFNEAVGIVVDGIGETAVTSLWRIQNNQYEKIKQIDYPNSLGYFYAIATKFLGFEPWSGEGKTMALAAYGKKNEEIANRLEYAFTSNGAFYDVSRFMQNHNAGFLMMNEDELIHKLEVLLGFSAREKDAPITDAHIDFAWFVQDYLERSVLFDEIDSIALDRTNSNDLREMGRATSTLLKEFDRLDDRIVLLATTNLFDHFDKALIRRFDSIIDFNRYTQEDLAEIAEVLLNDFLNKFKCTGRNIRLFRKIVNLMSPIPYPGELKNIIRASVAFSNPSDEFDYLKRFYKAGKTEL